MKITRKNIKALVFISLLIASLVSCGNLFTANIQTVTITGTIDMTEVNKSLLVNESTDYRTAWPFINAAGDYAAYTFKITAVGSEGEKTGTVDIINKTYSIPGLVPGNTYSVRLEMFDSNGNVLLYGDAEVAVDSINTSGPEIILTEHQEVSGKIYLPIEIDTSSNIKKIHAELKGTDYSIDVSISGNSTYIDFPDIPSNSYTLQLKFYASNSESNTDDAKYSLVYRCTETVNVYDGMTTDQWVDNANSAYFTETDGHTTFKLTNECLQQWYMNTIYVNTNAINSEGSGTRTNPCTSILLGIEKALDPSKTGERTIFIVNDSSEKISKPIEINLNDNKLTIEACNYDSDTHEYMENDEASFTITASGGFHFTIGSETEIKGMNIASHYENTEYSTQNGAFFSISSGKSAKFTGCSFSGGETTEKGGAIYNEGTVILDSCFFSGNKHEYSNGNIPNAIYCPDTEGVSPSLVIKGSTYFDTESGDTIELSNNSTITLDNEWELPEGAGDYCGNIKFNCEMPSSKEEAVRYPLFTGNLSSTAFTLENDYQSLTTDGYICQFPEAIYVDGSLELEYNSTDSEHPYGEGTVKKPYSNLNAFDYDNLSTTTFIYIKNGSDVSPSWITVSNYKKLHFNVYNPVNGTINGEDDRAQIKSSQTPDYTLPNKTKDYTIRTIHGTEIWLANIDFINDDYTNTFGGGFLDIHGKAHITKCTFNGGISNYSKGGGAIMLYDTAECTIEGCTFRNCQSTSTNTTGGGGAIYNSGTCDCEDCEFTECTAESNGGAIFNAESATIKNVTIKSCSASYTMTDPTSSGGDNIGGGAIYNAGSLTITRKEDSDSTDLVNTITQCSTSFTYHQDYTGDSFNNLGGGAIFNWGVCTIEYCTISNNSAQITRTSTENSEGRVLINSNKTTLNYCYLSSPNTSINDKNDKAIYNTAKLIIQNIYSNTKIDEPIYCEGNATLTLGFWHTSQTPQSISLNALGNYAKLTLAKSDDKIPKITSSETLNSSSYKFPLYFENISDFVGEDNSPFGDNVKTYADGIFSLADKNYAIEDGIIIEDLPPAIALYINDSPEPTYPENLDEAFSSIHEDDSGTIRLLARTTVEVGYSQLSQKTISIEVEGTGNATIKLKNQLDLGNNVNFNATGIIFDGEEINPETAYNSGGLFYIGCNDGSSRANVSFKQCTFKNGKSQDNGGALYVQDNLTLEDCTFENNTMNTDTPNDIVVWCGSLTLKGKNTFSSPICCNQNESNSPSITVSDIDLTPGSPYAEISCFDWTDSYVEPGYQIISGLKSGQESWFPCVDEGGYAIDSDGKILKSFSSIPNVSDIATDSPVILTPDSGVSASDISTFLNSEGDFKVNLDLSNLSAADIKNIDPTLKHVDTLTLPGGNYDSNLYGHHDGGTANGLRKVIIKGDISDPWLFQNCTGIEEVEFTEGVTQVPDGIFAGCTSLKTVSLPSTLETIGYHAFADSAIKEITIPASVTTIKHFAFYSTQQTVSSDYKLQSVTFEDTSHTWAIKEGGTGDTLWFEATAQDNISVSNSSTNAIYFKQTWGCSEGYWWVKNE